MPLIKLKGAHVPHRKNTAQMAAVRMPAPKSVTIPVVMHIGAPAVPAVKGMVWDSALSFFKVFSAIASGKVCVCMSIIIISLLAIKSFVLAYFR